MGKHHVKKREQRAVLAYAVKVMATMGLPTFRVLLMEDPAPPEALAMVKATPGRNVACLWLSKDWMGLDSDVRRDSVTHEVLHLWHRDLTDLLEDEVQPLLHDHEYARMERQWRRELELMVDHIALFMGDTHRLQEAWDEAHA